MSLSLLEKQLRCLEKEAHCNFGTRIQKLGEGAFGTVVQGTYTRHGQNTLVAVKLAKSRSTPGHDPHAALKNECCQLRKVSPPEQPHPHIVTLILAGVMYDPITSHETNAMIMELCSEGSLWDFQRRGTYPLSRLQILYQICNALAYMHHRGVYHRDLKPENILIQRTRFTYTCKIADFGLATDQPFSNDAAGTIPYIAPETLSCPPPYSCAMGDVFSVGVILYEMLAGTIPWSTNRGKIEFVRGKRWTGTVASVFDTFLESTWNLDPNRRASASELEQMAWVLWRKASS